MNTIVTYYIDNLFHHLTQIFFPCSKLVHYRLFAGSNNTRNVMRIPKNLLLGFLHLPDCNVVTGFVICSLSISQVSLNPLWYENLQNRPKMAKILSTKLGTPLPNL